MNNKVTHIFAFLAGAAVGTAVSWKLLKTKYERIADEEIESVKESFSNGEPDPEKEEDQDVEDLKYADDIIHEQGYVPNESNATIKNEKGNSAGGVKKVTDLYVISPGDAGEDDYEIESLTYYAGDNMLTDQYGNPVSLRGVDPEPHFGEFEDDSVYVRSEKEKIDYEIIRDLRLYSEVMSRTSHHSTDGND